MSTSLEKITWNVLTILGTCYCMFTYLLSGTSVEEGINVEYFPEFFSSHAKELYKSGFIGGK